DHVEALPVLEPRHRFARGRRLADLHARARRRGAERATRRSVVVDDEQTPIAQARMQRWPGRHLGDLADDREMERRAAAGLAVDPDAAAHHFAQALADREPQAGAAVVARRARVDLAEALEQLRDLVGRNADAGVAHGEMEFVAVAIVERPHRHLHGDLALARELHRVVEVIREHLAHAPAVAEHALGRAVGDLVGQIQELVGSRERDQVEGVLDALAQVERQMLSVSLPASIFEKSRMSLMIDSRCCPLARMVSAHSRWRSDISVSASRSVMPMIAFIGVRISWLMLATNSLLARLATRAASAASFARRLAAASS